MDWLNNPEAFDRFHKDGVDDFPGAVAGAGINRRKNMNETVEALCSALRAKAEALEAVHCLTPEEQAVMAELNRLTLKWLEQQKN